MLANHSRSEAEDRGDTPGRGRLRAIRLGDHVGRPHVPAQADSSRPRVDEHDVAAVDKVVVGRPAGRATRSSASRRPRLLSSPCRDRHPTSSSGGASVALSALRPPACPGGPGAGSPPKVPPRSLRAWPRCRRRSASATAPPSTSAAAATMRGFRTTPPMVARTPAEMRTGNAQHVTIATTAMRPNPAPEDGERLTRPLRQIAFQLACEARPILGQRSGPRVRPDKGATPPAEPRVSRTTVLGARHVILRCCLYGDETVARSACRSAACELAPTANVKHVDPQPGGDGQD